MQTKRRSVQKESKENMGTDTNSLLNPRDSMWERMMERTAEAPVKSRDPRKQASLKMFIENSQTGRILQPAI